MSEAYFKLKTISILIHKDAVPNAIKGKLDLN
jgi:bleomycin hydrolase